MKVWMKNEVNCGKSLFYKRDNPQPIFCYQQKQVQRLSFMEYQVILFDKNEREAPQTLVGHDIVHAIAKAMD